MPGRVLSTRLGLLDSLKGQTLVLPDLRQYWGHWPAAVNPEFDRLKREVDEWLDRTIPSPKLRRAFQIADIGLLGACVYPFASYDRLKIASLLNIWIFIVDDELDMESGTMVDDLETSNQYRAELIDFVRECLGLGRNGKTGTSNCAVKGTGYTHIIKSFELLGREIQAAYNIEQRERLLDSIIFYLGMTREEQCSRLAGGIPTPEEYWSFRDGASAVDATLAMIEYLADARGLPKQVFDDPDMKRLWTLTNTNVSLVNDLFSAKKELAGQSIANAIPIWYAAAQGKDRLQVATEQAVEMFVQTVRDIDDTAETLMNRYGNGFLDERLTRELEWFIDGCKTWCTGNYYWSLETPRYGRLEKNCGKNGRIYITL